VSNSEASTSFAKENCRSASGSISVPHSEALAAGSSGGHTTVQGGVGKHDMMALKENADAKDCVPVSPTGAGKRSWRWTTVIPRRRTKGISQQNHDRWNRSAAAAGRTGMCLVLSTIVTAGCATMESDWRKAQDRNTRLGYGEFLACRPDSPQAADAKRRMQDPEYAFLQTCSIASKQAFEGFAGDYANHPLAAVARHRILFLDETVEHSSWDGYWKFAVRHPDNPFAVEARTAIPLLWIRETRSEVAVVIQINASDPNALRLKLGQQMRDELSGEGINPVFIPPGSDARANSNLTVAVVVCYNEAPGVQPLPVYAAPVPGANPLAHIAAQSVGAAAGAVVAGILFGGSGTKQCYRVFYRKPDGTFKLVYDAVEQLRSPAVPVDRRLAVEALGGADARIMQVILRGRP